jgi:predicted nucleic-acid-binding Zn-ribbon protein
VENSIKCPKCNSTQITANKKGFSVGKAAAGVILTGGIGVVAGAIGSNNIEVTCLSCGYSWSPSEYKKQTNRDQAIKRADELSDWKKAWRKKYELQEFDEATIIFKRRGKFTSLLPDIHNVYLNQVRKEKQDKVIGIVLLTIIGVIFLLIMVFKNAYN